MEKGFTMLADPHTSLVVVFPIKEKEIKTTTIGYPF